MMAIDEKLHVDLRQERRTGKRAWKGNSQKLDILEQRAGNEQMATHGNVLAGEINVRRAKK